ncbi:MAG TPA: glutamate-1-semialdehyde 2,1-aminomutase [Terriglobales bacterium]|nr:glutamate-1-semialdehyde 2,1-aminomutase [Terriglobales bacterium]
MPRKLDRSRELQKKAEALMPGGVSSPVRAFLAVGGEPPFLVRGRGARVWDADDNEYLDYLGSWGPLILGHAEPRVVAEVELAARNGTSFGASTPAEAALADLVTEAMPSIEKIRFVNSGTEATMSAIRVARAFTGRKYVIKFEGCYHGHADSLLVKAGSGVATLGIPGSAGVPEFIAQFTLALPFNNVEALQDAFRRLPGEIACVIVEPVVGNMGVVKPAPGYLDALRYITSRHGALLIFDEVMTGFRLAWGGAQGRYGVVPDMTTLGKIIGGGLPVGAYGGPAEMMDLVAPLGPVYQAGTLSGNPLAMAAGLATLRYLQEHRRTFYTGLEDLTRQLVAGVTEAAQQNGIALTHNQAGSMFTWFFTNTEVRDWATAQQADAALYGRFHRGMLDEGVYLPPSQFEAAFLSGAHTDDDVSQTIEAALHVFAEMSREQRAKKS